MPPLPTMSVSAKKPRASVSGLSWITATMPSSSACDSMSSAVTGQATPPFTDTTSNGAVASFDCTSMRTPSTGSMRPALMRYSRMRSTGRLMGFALRIRTSTSEQLGWSVSTIQKSPTASPSGNDHASLCRACTSPGASCGTTVAGLPFTDSTRKGVPSVLSMMVSPARARSPTRLM